MISLRSHFEALLRERDRAAARESAEVHRRLDNLNHVHEREARERALFVSREEYGMRHEELIRRLVVLETWRANLIGRMVGLAAVGAIALSAVSAFVGHLVS